MHTILLIAYVPLTYRMYPSYTMYTIATRTYSHPHTYTPFMLIGVISRDPSVKLQRTLKDIQRISHIQKELLCAAVDAVDPRSPTGMHIHDLYDIYYAVYTLCFYILTHFYAMHIHI